MSLSFVRRIAIAALALPLLLGGCTDDEPDPKVPETSSPSSPTTETSTAAPVEPTLPPEAEGKGTAAAEAFVPFFYAAVDHAQVTGDTQALRTLALDECDACRGGADVIDKIDSQGGTIAGGEHTVASVNVTGRRRIPGEGFIYYADVSVSHTDQTIEGTKDFDGDYAAGTDELRFVLVRSTTGWQVSQWFEA